MALLVQKYGGSSLGSVERIKIVAEQIKESKDNGHKVVVVVSAMSGQTNALHSLAHSLSKEPSKSELDAILATGEQVAAAMLAIALSDIGCSAQSFGAMQLDMRGDDCSNYARLLNLSTDRLRVAFAAGITPIVTGFQAVGSNRQWLTLGRGGSDTTAVALAAKLAADECQIFTDVTGIYSADPRVVKGAKLLDKINLLALSYLASAGAKVMQRRAIECACRHKVVLRILSSFEPGQGTLVICEDSMEDYEVTGIAFERDQLYIEVTLSGAEFKAALTRFMRFFVQLGVHLDCLRQDYRDASVQLSFLIPASLRSDFNSAISCCQSPAIDVEFSVQSGVARLAVVGIGIGTRPQVADDISVTLDENAIIVKRLLTDEHRYTLLLSGDVVELAAKCLHKELVNKQEVVEERSNKKCLFCSKFQQLYELWSKLDI